MEPRPASPSPSLPRQEEFPQPSGPGREMCHGAEFTTSQACSSPISCLASTGFLGCPKAPVESSFWGCRGLGVTRWDQGHWPLGTEARGWMTLPPPREVLVSFQSYSLPLEDLRGQRGVRPWGPVWCGGSRGTLSCVVSGPLPVGSSAPAAPAWSGGVLGSLAGGW